MHLLEVVLGYLRFDRVNELQIGKFHLGWKVDFNKFPTSYHELNLDSGKYFKIGLKGARPTWLRGATHMIGTLAGGKLYIFGFFMEIYASSEIN